MVQHMNKKVKYNFSGCVDSCGAKEHYFHNSKRNTILRIFGGFCCFGFFLLNKDRCFLKEELDRLSVGIYKVLKKMKLYSHQALSMY